MSEFLFALSGFIGGFVSGGIVVTLVYRNNQKKIEAAAALAKQQVGKAKNKAKAIEKAIKG